MSEKEPNFPPPPSIPLSHEERLKWLEERKKEMKAFWKKIVESEHKQDSDKFADLVELNHLISVLSVDYEKDLAKGFPRRVRKQDLQSMCKFFNMIATLQEQLLTGMMNLSAELQFVNMALVDILVISNDPRVDAIIQSLQTEIKNLHDKRQEVELKIPDNIAKELQIWLKEREAEKIAKKKVEGMYD